MLFDRATNQHLSILENDDHRSRRVGIGRSHCGLERPLVVFQFPV